MELKEIFTISGFGGLYKYVSQARNGIIVESLDDKKRMIAYNHYKMMSLADIAIFCENGETPIREIFQKIKEKEKDGPIMGGKIDEKKLKSYFEEILPDYDKERVYTSDIKKVLNWYNILQRNGINNFDETKELNDTENNDEKQKPLEEIQQP